VSQRYTSSRWSEAYLKIKQVPGDWPPYIVNANNVITNCSSGEIFCRIAHVGDKGPRETLCGKRVRSTLAPTGARRLQREREAARRERLAEAARLA
jgi:hypothetical protein